MENHPFPHSGSRLVALTFDDGPCEPATSQVLDILREHDVPATFFLVGENVRRYPELAKRITQEGHGVGNHTDTHHWRLLFGRRRHILEDVQNCEQAIREATGVTTRLFRPPYGRASWWAQRALVKQGYTLVRWHSMSFDYWGLPAKLLTRRIVSQCKKDGGIVVLHDGVRTKARAPRPNVAAALPRIIEELRRRNFELVRLDELIARDTQQQYSDVLVKPTSH